MHYGDNAGHRACNEGLVPIMLAASVCPVTPRPLVAWIRVRFIEMKMEHWTGQPAAVGVLFSALF